jgi:hypothetical protein
MSAYDCIFVNGDSYSAPQGNKVYADFLGDSVGVPVKNYALAGSNNDRILRTSIEFLNQIKTEYKNPLVIIGWSFVNRIEIWEDRENLSILNNIPDRNYFPGIKFITIDHLLNSNNATVEQKSLVLNDIHRHKQLMNFYTNLYLFSHLLDLLNFDYRFFSAADNKRFFSTDYPTLDLHSQVQWVKNNKKNYKFDSFCIQQWANINDSECDPTTGHLSENGHKKFAKVLLDIIKETA